MLDIQCKAHQLDNAKEHSRKKLCEYGPRIVYFNLIKCASIFRLLHPFNIEGKEMLEERT